MNVTQFKTDAAVGVITQALDDFLRDKSLRLTTQQYSRIKKLLMIRLLEDEMTYSNAYNQLSEIMEYRKDYEISANAPDEAEEEMIRIIGAADVREIKITIENAKFKKRFIVATSILSLVFIFYLGFITFQHFENDKIHALKMASIITPAEETSLKNLVQRVIELEKSNGSDVSHGSIYNKIKNLDAIKSHGDATSYKKFNRAQLTEAVIFLNQWIKNIQEKTISGTIISDHYSEK